MKVFVTGASGFLGLDFARGARARGHAVVALVRRPSPELEDAGCSVLLKDVMDVAAADLPQGIDAIVHFATGREGDEEQITRVAVESTLGMYRIARELSIPRFVHISSMSVYPGPVAPDPTRLDGLSLEPRPERRGSYVLSKTRADAALQDAIAARGSGATEVDIIRPGLVFGADLGGVLWGTANDLPLGLALVRGRPEHAVPLLHVRDLTAGLLALLDRAPRPGSAEVFDILSGTPPSRREFLRKYRALSGQPAVQLSIPRPVMLTATRALDALATWRGRPAVPEVLAGGGDAAIRRRGELHP